MYEPSVAHVGHVVQLNSGHTREFSWREEARLNAHLMYAGFGENELSSQMAMDMLSASRGSRWLVTLKT